MISESAGFELPIKLSLQPSKWLIAFIFLIHVSALACIYLANISMLMMQLTCLITLSSFVYYYYNYVFQLKKNPTQLLLNDKDEWYISDEKKGETYPILLSSETLVHRYLIVMLFKQENHKRVVVLTPDNIKVLLFRRLRVRLRFSLSVEER